MVNLIFRQVEDKNCGTLLVNQHLAKVSVEQELFVLEVLLLLLFFSTSSRSLLLLCLGRLRLLGLPWILVACRLGLLADEANLSLILGPCDPAKDDVVVYLSHLVGDFEGTAQRLRRIARPHLYEDIFVIFVSLSEANGDVSAAGVRLREQVRRSILSDLVDWIDLTSVFKIQVSAREAE